MTQQQKQPTIPFRDLRLEGPHFKNPRISTGTSPLAIAELAINIGTNGLFTPLLVTHANVILDGGRRYRAITWLLEHCTDEGLSLPLELEITVTPDEASVICARADKYREATPITYYTGVAGAKLEGVALAGNLQRANLSSYEVACYLQHLVAQGLSQKQIANLIGKSETYVSTRLTSIAGAGPELAAAWEAGKLADAKVHELAMMPPAVQKRRIEAGDLPTRGAVSRPSIDVVKDLLADVEADFVSDPSPTIDSPITEEEAEILERDAYRRAVRDTLRWVAGRNPDGECFAELVKDVSK